MRILLIGGTGAMGVPLMARLRSRNDEVYVTSRSAHHSEDPRIHWVQGNARDEEFFREHILAEHWDAIVDFMVYEPEEFKERYERLLDATDQYLFFSSSRVYASSDAPLNENSPRLSDVCTDKEYLRTNEYALAKAREEDLLTHSERRNWTIIRPYITYGNARLQLGVYEKEDWLYRAMHNRTVVFFKDIGERVTTLTSSEDVVRCISKLIGNPAALGQTVQIAGEISITWREVLEIYSKTFEEVTGKPLRVKWFDSYTQMNEKGDLPAQVKYDRLYNRRFDSSRAVALCGEGQEKAICTIPPQEGLADCLRAFLKEPHFLKLPWTKLIWMDKLTGEYAHPSEFASFKAWMRYMRRRCLSSKTRSRLHRLRVALRGK